ncbi:unnamed protein product [Rotaria sp. Silwood2]|nr:unnamed protein product [Rotaria sp. Silwood2]CAF4258044.1 unnamed protein product [Rotaria sp. Silwood2]
MSVIQIEIDKIRKQFKQLRAWKSSEKDPFDELEQWRVNAHIYIDQIYERKRAEINSEMKRYEKQLFREAAKEWNLFNAIRKQATQGIRHAEQNHVLSGNNESILISSLHKIETEINTNLRSGEIIIETVPFNLEETIKISLRTDVITPTRISTRKSSTADQWEMAKRKRKEDAARGFEEWKQKKDQELIDTRRSMQQAERERRKQEAQAQMQKTEDAHKAYEEWIESKDHERMFKKK